MLIKTKYSVGDRVRVSFTESKTIFHSQVCECCHQTVASGSSVPRTEYYHYEWSATVTGVRANTRVFFPDAQEDGLEVLYTLEPDSAEIAGRRNTRNVFTHPILSLIGEDGVL